VGRQLPFCLSEYVGKSDKGGEGRGGGADPLNNWLQETTEFGLTGGVVRPFARSDMNVISKLVILTDGKKRTAECYQSSYYLSELGITDFNI